MILLKIYYKVTEIPSGSDGYGFEQVVSKEISIVAEGEHEELCNLAKEEQIKHKGNAQFLLLNGTILDVPYVEPKKKFILSVTRDTFSQTWHEITVECKPSELENIIVEERYSEYHIESEEDI